MPMPFAQVPPPRNVENEEQLEEVSALFEWVGLASLGSERCVRYVHSMTPFDCILHRLRVNDSVDPYLAVYDPPLAMETGDLVTVRWIGLFTPSFVQSILDSVRYVMNTLNT